MGYVLITPPATLAVTLAAAKEYLRILHDDEDAAIERLIAAATSHAETMTGRLIAAQTWEYRLPSFGGAIAIEKGPVASITSVTYRDGDGVDQVLASTAYALAIDEDPQQLLATGEWPAGASAVRVRYAAGFAESDPVLAAIRQAILMLVGHWFDNRSTAAAGTTTEIPLSFDALLWPHRARYL